MIILNNFKSKKSYERDDNEQQVSSTSSDNVQNLLPSTSRSIGYGISAEKSEDLFTKTSKMMNHTKPGFISNNNFNIYKRYIFKNYFYLTNWFFLGNQIKFLPKLKHLQILWMKI